MLHIFGCLAYYLVKDKLEPRIRKTKFIEFKRGVKEFKLWDPVDRKFVLSRDVTFNEASMVKPQISKQAKDLEDHNSRDIAVGGEWRISIDSSRISFSRCASSDVKTVLLYGDLDEIFMIQPQGFKFVGKKNKVCKLKKSLYGLKKSPRQWYKRFDTFMAERVYEEFVWSMRVLQETRA